MGNYTSTIEHYNDSITFAISLWEATFAILSVCQAQKRMVNRRERSFSALTFYNVAYWYGHEYSSPELIRQSLLFERVI